MKFFTSQFTYFFQANTSQRNIRLLLRFLAVLAGLVAVYTVLFHLLMEWEGQEHSWLTGLYWVLTTMSTLGFGDITFDSDVGRTFSIIVLMSGMFFLLILLPFTFIEFFYAPWMEAQSAARAPRELPAGTHGHVILTNYDPVTHALIKRLSQYGYSYALVVKELNEALKLYDLGFHVVVGEVDMPETYHRLRVDQAALVAATGGEILNTNIAFTVRELTKQVPVVTTANTQSATEILKLAGSSHVFQLGKLMGQSLARRTLGGDAVAHVIGRIDQLLIAEATAAGTPLVGRTLAESNLRALAGITVVGVWERGQFKNAGADTVIGDHTVLVLAGSGEQLRAYNELFCIYHQVEAPAIIIGGGRVGRATGRSLEGRKMDYRIVEQLPERIRQNGEKYILGNAAELETLEQAGIKQAPAVIITTHDDDTNIFLTIFCRRLRPDIQIISRTTRERNISTLHRAGADFVMSYASMGANIIFNVLKRNDILMLAEGVNVFKVQLPPFLEGKSLAESNLRRRTGCNVIAMHTSRGFEINPDPQQPLETKAELILIGNVESEQEFLKLYSK